MELDKSVEAKKEILSKVIGLVNNLMGYIDLYESNRPGSIAFTKLEEAVMWLQVMITNCPLKEDVKEKLVSLQNEIKEKEIATSSVE